MNRRSTVPAAVTLVLLVAAGADRSRPSRPVARVLEVKGMVTIASTGETRRPAAVYGSLYKEDRLVVGRDSMAVLGFRSNGQMVRVTAPGELTVTETGVDKNTGVELVEVPEDHRPFVNRAVMKLQPITRGGVMILRGLPGDALAGEDRPKTKGLEPTHGSTVLSNQPKFRWPAVPGAIGYDVTLSYQDGPKFWSASTSETSLSADRQLRRGFRYAWQVTATLAEDVDTRAFEGRFTVATDRQRAEAAQVEELIAQPEVPYLALAAMWYRQNGLLAEAIEVSQRIARLQPDAASAQWALYDLYRRAGRHEMAQRALDRARQLRPSPPRPEKPAPARIRSIFGDQPE